MLTKLQLLQKIVDAGIKLDSRFKMKKIDLEKILAVCNVESNKADEFRHITKTDQKAETELDENNENNENNESNETNDEKKEKSEVIDNEELVNWVESHKSSKIHEIEKEIEAIAHLDTEDSRCEIEILQAKLNTELRKDLPRLLADYKKQKKLKTNI